MRQTTPIIVSLYTIMKKIEISSKWLKITTITPYFFDNYLIISLHKDWINKFGKIPDFDVFIEKNKLYLVSKEEIQI